MAFVAYATHEQVSEYLSTDTDIPDDLDRLLLRASDRIDSYVLAGYSVDAITGLPRDSRIAEALANATCAQVEFWCEVGEEHDIDGVRGQMTVPGSTFQAPPTLAPRARAYLVSAGLMDVGRVGV